MKIPQSIQDYILNKCKNGKCILELKEVTTERLCGRLEFDEQGMSKTVDLQVSIIGYIERILTYSRRDVMIFLNDEPLDQCAPKQLEYCGESSDDQGS